MIRINLLLLVALPFVVHSQTNSAMECRVVRMLLPDVSYEDDCCLWDGISCGSGGRIKSILLSNHSLVGSIPTQIGLLSQLTHLDLSDNELTGSIPSDISYLTRLKNLELDENQLTGSLPSFPQKMSELKSLHLHYNNLSGSIPISSSLVELTSLLLQGNALAGLIPNKIRILSNLKILNLDDNELRGNIPTTIGNLGSLQQLRLNSNFLTGQIPTEIGKLPEMDTIDLYHNNLSGPIPSELASCTELRRLSLASNSLTGSVPENLPTNMTELRLYKNYLSGPIPMDAWTLDNLEEINLHNNALTGSIPSDLKLYKIKTIELGENELTGSIPTEIGILTKLENFDLHDNSLTGSIPTTIFKLEMSDLRLNNNTLTGEIPSEIGMLSNSLTKFQASYNSLSGSIPSVVGWLSKLKYLELHGNRLTGKLPSEMERMHRLKNLHIRGNEISGSLPNLQDLTNLERIVLGENYISGSIPEGINSLSVLGVLELQENRLTGQVPCGIGNCSSLSELYLHGNMFTGHIPNRIGDLFNLKYLDASSNQFTGQLPTQMQQLRLMRTLRLENNNISGSIPLEFFQNMPGLKNFSFAFNQFDFTLDADFLNFVSHMEAINLTGNKINGSLTLPLSTTISTNITQLHLGQNCLSGTLPSGLTNYLPSIEDLDLSAKEDCPQKCFKKDYDCLRNAAESEIYVCEGTRFEFEEDEFGGVEEEACVTKLGFYGSIPLEYIRLDYLRKINLSGNVLSGSIPTIFNDAFPLVEEFDLSNNELSGLIPVSLASIGGSTANPENVAISLANNNFNATDALAPHSLCELVNFDLSSDSTYCPKARSYLQSFFDGCKGSDWRTNKNWEDEYQHHCDYFGVTCPNDRGIVTGLQLDNNGLAGRLAPQVGKLKALRVLNLSDNDIRGTIPSEISGLTNLKTLNLAYNLLDGEIPSVFSNIVKNLELLKIHGNRLFGEINGISHSITGTDPSDLSTFVADCGHPSEAESPVVCEDCTMCCNANGMCETRISENSNIILSGVENNFLRYCGVGLAVLVSCCALFLTSFFSRKTRKSQPNHNSDFRHLLGEDSVYTLLLIEKWNGWVIAVLVSVIQMVTFYIFYEESILDFDREDYYNVAWIYRWWCPRNQTCEQQIVKSELGWIFFGVLVAFHLIPDFWNGYKVIWMITNITGNWKAFRGFVAGYLRLVVGSYAIFVSVVFNIGNASSNTDLIINAVILLFIADFDELCFRILKECFPEYLEDDKTTDNGRMVKEHHQVAMAHEETYVVQQLQRRVDQLKADNVEMEKENSSMKKDINDLKNQMRSLLAGSVSSADYTTSVDHSDDISEVSA